MNKKMILKKIQCFYVYFNEPRQNDDGSAKYQCQAVVDINDQQAQSLRSAIEAVATEEFGKYGNVKLPIHSGDAEKPGDPAYAGKIYFNISSRNKPGLVNKYCEPATAEQLAEWGNSGQIFNLSINIYAYSVQGRRGIGLGLNNVMLCHSGQKVTGSDPLSDFAGMAEKLLPFPDDQLPF